MLRSLLGCLISDWFRRLLFFKLSLFFFLNKPFGNPPTLTLPPKANMSHLHQAYPSGYSPLPVEQPQPYPMMQAQLDYVVPEQYPQPADPQNLQFPPPAGFQQPAYPMAYHQQPYPIMPHMAAFQPAYPNVYPQAEMPFTGQMAGQHMTAIQYNFNPESLAPQVDVEHPQSAQMKEEPTNNVEQQVFHHDLKKHVDVVGWLKQGKFKP